jgi:putative Mn2+ efflux pump MntP
MSLGEILLTAIALAMDAAAVSLAASAAGCIPDRISGLRLALHFGFFQFAMPVIGWLLGTRVAGLVGRFDHWIAFGLLLFVAGRMLRAGMRRTVDCPPDPSRGLTLLILSLATSIDALAVGLSLAMVRIDIWQPSVIIGLVTMLLSLIALRLGRFVAAAFGKRMEIVGGLILILIGARILITHLRGGV